MKKNFIVIVMLLLTNLFSVSAATKETDSTKGLCNVTITVDKASNVKAITSAGHGTTLTLVDGENELQIDDSENPLQIEPVDGATIVSVKQNGSEKPASGDGKYRLGIMEGMTLEITTKSLSADPTVTFSVDDPSHIVVKAGEEVISDLSSSKTFTKGTILTITAADGYKIRSLSTDNMPTVPEIDGVYTLKIDGDMTIYVYTEAAHPIVTFDVDFPARVMVMNTTTQTPVDIITTSEVSLPKGTVLEIKASLDTKYTIKSFKVNGDDKQPSGGSNIYNVGIAGNTTIAIETTSNVPAVKFVVDRPENVKVHILGSDEALDLSKAYEMEKNTQLVIEPANDEVRIASVMANGLKLTPSPDGTYMTSVSTDMTLEIKTKGIMPGLTFRVDAPERINVLKGNEKLDISDLIEVPAGTQITIEPAADNFLIRSVVANGETLTAGTDGKYQVTVSGDMEFEIKTAANLTLHIVQPEEGGTVSVFRNEVELHDGDKVLTGDVLQFKNKVDEGYVFVSYLVKGEKCIDTYTVFGSEDITVSAEFKLVPEGYALVTFDMNEDALTFANVRTFDGSDWTTLDASQPCEVKINSVIKIYVFSSTIFISSCQMNGVEMVADQGQDNKSYSGVIQDKTVVMKVRAERRVSVSGDITNDPITFARIGRTLIKYNDKIETSHIVPAGTTVEVIAEPADGYELDYLYDVLSDPEGSKLSSTTYTVENTEREIIVIKGAFKEEVEQSVDKVNSLQSYYDAATLQIITRGGLTEVYTISGEKVLESTDMNISVSTLHNGMYIVKTQDGVFKMVKK